MRARAQTHLARGRLCPLSSVVRTGRVQTHQGCPGCAAAVFGARVSTACTPVARTCVAVRCSGTWRRLLRVNPSIERARRARLRSATPCAGALRLAPGCVRAGNEAGECYVKLSECHLKLDSKHEAASALVDASNAFKKNNKRGVHAARTLSEPCEPHHPPPDVRLAPHAPMQSLQTASTKPQSTSQTWGASPSQPSTSRRVLAWRQGVLCERSLSFVRVRHVRRTWARSLRSRAT